MTTPRHTSQTWMDDALCQQFDPELFFPNKGGNWRIPKRICNMCPVKPDCLNWALTTGQQHGVWGGTTYKQRLRLPGWTPQPPGHYSLTHYLKDIDHPPRRQGAA